MATENLEIRIRADINNAQKNLKQLQNALKNASDPKQIRNLATQLNSLSKSQTESSKTLINTIKANTLADKRSLQSQITNNRQRSTDIKKSMSTIKSSMDTAKKSAESTNKVDLFKKAKDTSSIKSSMSSLQSSLTQTRQIANTTNTVQVFQNARNTSVIRNALTNIQGLFTRARQAAAATNTTDVFQRASVGLSTLSSRLRSVSGSIKNVGSTIKNIGTSFISNISMPIIKGLGAAAEANKKFEQQLSFTASKANATTQELSSLKQQAIQLGVATKYSSLEVAQGQEEMVKAGRNVKQILSEMNNVLSLATAGNIDIAEASKIGANTLNMFAKQGLNMKDATDLIAAGSNKSATNVTQLYHALSYSGSTAAAIKMPFSDVIATLSLMADNAIFGSRAGTSLTGILTRLNPASDQAAQAMHELGIITKDGGNKFFTASGEFQSMDNILNVLRDSVSGLTDEVKEDKLKAIFGAIAGRTVKTLLNTSADALENVRQKLRGISAEDVAAGMMNNFAGQMDLLRGSIETFLQIVGESLTPFLRIAAKAATNFVNVLLKLPKPIIAIGVVFAAFVASLGFVIAAFGQFVLIIGGIVGIIAGAVAGISAIAGVISTVAGVIASIGFPPIGIIILAIAAALGIAAAAFVSFVASLTFYTAHVIKALMPIRSTFMLLKKAISGDFAGAVDVLVSKFGMTNVAAFQLANRFAVIKDKAIQLYKVISANLKPMFSIISNEIGGTISSLLGFDKGLDKSKENAIGMFSGIIKWLERFVNYFYKVFDSFGLIPTEVKFANDKTALEFIKLNSNTKNALDEVIRTNRTFGETLVKENKETYDRVVGNVQEALDGELGFLKENLAKKQSARLKASEEMFKASSALTEKEEQEALKKIGEFNTKETSKVKEKYDQINAIIETARKEKRATTEAENNEMLTLQKDASITATNILTESKLKQQAILEESANMATTIKREEGLRIITEANLTHDAEIKAQADKKDSIIKDAIYQRDVIGSLSAEQAQKVITEAQNQYTASVAASTKTKTETVQNAFEKANGTISESEREARQIPVNTENLRNAMRTIWNDIKTEVVAIVVELVHDVISALGSTLLQGVSNAISAVGKVLADGLLGLGEMAANSNFITGSLLSAGKGISAVGKAKGGGGNTSSSGSKAKATTKKATPTPHINQPFTTSVFATGRKYANGTSYAEGGLSLVGERGPELVDIPKGSKVYTANESHRMIRGFAGGTKSSIKTSSQKFVEKLNASKSKSSSKSKTTASSKAAKAAATAKAKAEKAAAAAATKRKKEAEKAAKAAAKEAEKKKKAAEKAAAAAKKAAEAAAKAAQKQKDSVSKSVASFVNNVQKQGDSLLNFGNLFEKVSMEKLSGQKLLNNLKTQVSYMNEWKSNLDSLGKKIGKTSNLYNELLMKGPEAASEIGALSKLGQDKLKDYTKTFEQKRNISYEMGYQMEAAKYQADLKQQQTILNITGNTISDTLDIDIMANKIIQKLKISGVT